MLITELINDKKLSPQQFPNVYRFGSLMKSTVANTNFIVASVPMSTSGSILALPAMLINKNRYAK